MATSRSSTKSKPKKKSSAPKKSTQTATKFFSGSAVPKRSKDVLARRNIDGGVAIMCLDNDQFFFTLDGIAAEAWEMIDGKASVDKISESLTAKHNPPEDAFKKDLHNLLNDLVKEKLITVN